MSYGKKTFFISKLYSVSSDIQISLEGASPPVELGVNGKTKSFSLIGNGLDPCEPHFFHINEKVVNEFRC